jgi:hypothetical protein
VQVKKRLVGVIQQTLLLFISLVDARYVTISQQLSRPKKNGDAMMSQSPSKLRLSALIALVVGSMVGGGFFPCRKTWRPGPMPGRF